ncbi:MAG: GNAT family N-acetyltransferase [Candidatus Fimadaptatus sp.]
MIEIRSLQPGDADGFWRFLNELDSETEYMMYEPGERAQRSSPESASARLRGALAQGSDLLLGAFEAGRLVGYLWAERGALRRVAHTAYIVTGVLAAYRGRGIGTAFFERLDDWARTSGIVRLELTVECLNEAAVRLYRRSGFAVEGVRRKSMRVGGAFVDEYYMGKMV